MHNKQAAKYLTQNSLFIKNSHTIKDIQAGYLGTSISSDIQEEEKKEKELKSGQVIALPCNWSIKKS